MGSGWKMHQWLGGKFKCCHHWAPSLILAGIWLSGGLVRDVGHMVCLYVP
jgi:hypothetical protein